MNDGDVKGIRNAFKRVSRDVHFLNNERIKLAAAVEKDLNYLNFERGNLWNAVKSLQKENRKISLRVFFDELVLGAIFAKVYGDDIKKLAKKW